MPGRCGSTRKVRSPSHLQRDELRKLRVFMGLILPAKDRLSNHRSGCIRSRLSGVQDEAIQRLSIDRDVSTIADPG